MKKANYEWIELPSKGECYPIDSPLREGKVAVSYLTVKDEKVLMNPNTYTKDENAIDRLINEKIVNKDIDVSSLINGDRNAILLWLRRTSYGDNFSVKIKLQNDDTDKSFTTDVDLSKLKNKDFMLLSDDDGHFPYYTRSGDTIKFNYMTNREILDFDENIITDDMDYVTILDNLLRFVTVSVNDNTDKTYINQYIDNMDKSEYYLYRSYVQKNIPDVDNIVDIEFSQEMGGEVKPVLLQINETIFLNINDETEF